MTAGLPKFLNSLRERLPEGFLFLDSFNLFVVLLLKNIWKVVIKKKQIFYELFL
jgi:hypothetical protein